MTEQHLMLSATATGANSPFDAITRAAKGFSLAVARSDSAVEADSGLLKLAAAYRVDLQPLLRHGRSGSLSPRRLPRQFSAWSSPCPFLRARSSPISSSFIVRNVMFVVLFEFSIGDLTRRVTDRAQYCWRMTYLTSFALRS
jgi:hypothetical protein